MDKEFLSKQKYIYVIYASSDKVIHCQRFPIVYLNSEFLYFKTNQSKRLECIKTERVQDEFISPSSHGHYTQYFFKVENFNSKEVTEYVYKGERELKLKKEKDTLQRLKDEYEKKLKSYELLKSMIDKS